ncbi:MAG: phasin family protein [Methyloceanibacter sp.]
MLEGRPFAIPDQLRRLWESNLEQARLVYGQFVDMIARANALLTGVMPTSEAASEFAEIQQRTVQFAKQNADVYFSFVDDLAKANDLQEALAIQNRYVQTQMQLFTVQAQELGRLIAQATQRI